MSRCVDVCVKETCEGGVVYFAVISRIDCSEFLSWKICTVDVGISSCVPRRLAMAASLFKAMMCFSKT